MGRRKMEPSERKVHVSFALTLNTLKRLDELAPDNRSAYVEALIRRQRHKIKKQ